MLSRPSSSVSSPESGSSGASPQPAARQAPRPAHPGRHRPRAGAPVTATARPPRPACESKSLGAGRDQRPHPFPLGLLQPLRGPADPRQHPLLPSARFDPLADRHPPNHASSVQETGRRSGADGSIVTGTPMPTAPGRSASVSEPVQVEGSIGWPGRQYRRTSASCPPAGTGRDAGWVTWPARRPRAAGRRLPRPPQAQAALRPAPRSRTPRSS